MSKQIGLKEVAKEAGVSISTASRALNDDPRVSADTRRSIFAAAETLRASGLALRPSVRRTVARCVALVQPAHDPRLGDTEISIRVLSSMQKVAEQTGHAVVAGQLRASRSGAAALGFEQGLELDGVIGYRLTDEDVAGFVSACRLLELPFVILNRAEEDAGVPTCTVDHAASGALAAEHLLGLGHRHIGVLLNDLSVQSTRLRLEGLRRAMACQGLMLEPELTYTAVRESDEIQASLERLLEAGATAVVVAHDRLGANVLSRLASMRVSVPRQLSVISFDGTETAAISHPPLTSVYTPWGEMAEAATEMLNWLKRDPLLSGAKLTWQPRLNEAGSCAVCPRGVSPR